MFFGQQTLNRIIPPQVLGTLMIIVVLCQLHDNGVAALPFNVTVQTNPSNNQQTIKKNTRFFNDVLTHFFHCSVDQE